MKCRRLQRPFTRHQGKGRLSGITAKTALTRLYFIYCVSHRFIMTERKKLKKKLAKLKHHRSHLPRLIDCSEVYGDGYYTKEDLKDIDSQIREVEKKIQEIDLAASNGG